MKDFEGFWIGLNALYIMIWPKAFDSQEVESECLNEKFPHSVGYLNS